MGKGTLSATFLSLHLAPTIGNLRASSPAGETAGAHGCGFLADDRGEKLVIPALPRIQVLQKHLQMPLAVLMYCVPVLFRGFLMTRGFAISGGMA